MKVKNLKGKTEFFLLLLGVVYFYLSGLQLSFFIFWAYLALFSAVIWSGILSLYQKTKPASFWGFVVGANVFMLPIHIEWFLNNNMQTSSSTSSSTSGLIFAVMPAWAYIFGGVGMVIFAVFAKFWKRYRAS
ncbi:hypothetical protein [Alteromonas sp. a30]|uniref:hypothetical protein n=1 Tax=Alteromonas sp. a30 TaxID=2730917 RepID=UPI0022800758|nr:hypothetical protein [Alteromonas sp. a30]MCY7296622.1 hypothetical protein [Alteromonas sp. a30]